MNTGGDLVSKFDRMNRWTSLVLRSEEPLKPSVYAVFYRRDSLDDRTVCWPFFFPDWDHG